MEAPGYRTQLWILYGLAGGFVLFVLTRAPWQHKFMALTGVAAFALAAQTSRRLGPAVIAGKEPLFVAIAGAASLFVPVLFFAFPFSRESMAAILLGMLCIDGFWAIHRYPAPPGARLARRDSLAADLREGVFVGLFMATFFSLFAAAIMLVASLGEGMRAFSILGWVAGGYFAGGVCAGLVFGMLRPIAAFPLGRMTIGVLGGMAVYGSMAFIIPYVDPDTDLTLRMQLLMALALGVIVGPPAALGFGDH